MPIDQTPEQNYGDIEHWLEDSGRRTHNAEWVSSLYAGAASPPTPATPPRRQYVAQPELLVLFAAAASAYAVQYFIEVKLAIGSLGGVLVFVALK